MQLSTTNLAYLSGLSILRKLYMSCIRKGEFTANSYYNFSEVAGRVEYLAQWYQRIDYIFVWILNGSIII